MNEQMAQSELPTPELTGALRAAWEAAGESISRLKPSDWMVLGCLAIGLPKAINSDNSPIERFKGGVIASVGVLIGNTN